MEINLYYFRKFLYDVNFIKECMVEKNIEEVDPNDIGVSSDSSIGPYTLEIHTNNNIYVFDIPDLYIKKFLRKEKLKTIK